MVIQADEALRYLTSREDFWDQIDAGKHGGIKNGGCMFGGKVCESLRFQMEKILLSKKTLSDKFLYYFCFVFNNYPR